MMAFIDIADMPTLRALIAHWRFEGSLSPLDDLRSGGLAWYAEQRLLVLCRQHGLRPEFV